MCDPITRLDQVVNKTFLSNITDARFVLEDALGADVDVSLADIRGVLGVIQSKDREITEHIESGLAMQHLYGEANTEIKRLAVALNYAESMISKWIGDNQFTGEEKDRAAHVQKSARKALRGDGDLGGYPMEDAPKDGRHILLETHDFGWVEGCWSKDVANFYASNPEFSSYDPANAQGDWVSDWRIGGPDDPSDKRLYCGASPISWLPLPPKTIDPMFDDPGGGA